MPIPIGLAVMGAGGVAAGGAQAISGAFKSPYEKQQEAELRELREQQARGQRGTSAEQRARMHQEVTSGAVGQMEAARKRQEALAAATGQAGGAQLQQMRQAQQQATGQVMQQSALAQREADERARQQQEAREQQTAAAIEAARKERRQRVYGGIGQMVGAAGMLAGSVPEATRAADVAGAPIRDRAGFESYLRGEGFGEDAIRALMRMDNNQLTRTLQMVTQGDLSTPDAMGLDAILRAQAPQQAGLGGSYNLAAGMGYKP